MRAQSKRPLKPVGSLARWLLPAFLICLWAVAAQADPVTVAIPTSGAAGDPATLTGYLMRPEGAGPFPAVVALHGCGGLFGRRDKFTARHREWGDRLVAEGHVVLFPDSFNSRGVREICTTKSRSIEPSRERARDAYAALAWLRSQSFVRGDRIGLLGWSNGGSTVLGTVDAHQPARGDVAPWRFAVAFYPGCTTYDRRRAGWHSEVPLLILIGEADNWTPAAPCLSLARKARDMKEPVEVVTYPGAYHEFDAPNVKLRERTGLAYTVSGDGKATVGTDPAARAAAIPRAMAFMDGLSR